MSALCAAITETGPANLVGERVTPWSRKTNKTIYVSFSHGSVRSNFIAIPARRG